MINSTIITTIKTQIWSLHPQEFNWCENKGNKTDTNHSSWSHTNFYTSLAQLHMFVLCILKNGEIISCEGTGFFDFLLSVVEGSVTQCLIQGLRKFYIKRYHESHPYIDLPNKGNTETLSTRVTIYNSRYSCVKCRLLSKKVLCVIPQQSVKPSTGEINRTNNRNEILPNVAVADLRGGGVDHAPRWPVKISHKKEGCRMPRLIFHVSHPPPSEGFGSATEVVLLSLSIFYLSFGHSTVPSA